MIIKLLSTDVLTNLMKSIFQNDLANANFDIVETIEDTNEAFEVFYNILNSVLNKNAPIKYKKVKRLQQPGWYNENVKQARSLKDKYKRESNWPQYKLWRNKCNSAIKMAKKEYFRMRYKTKQVRNRSGKLLN